MDRFRFLESIWTSFTFHKTNFFKRNKVGIWDKEEHPPTTTAGEGRAAAAELARANDGGTWWQEGLRAVQRSSAETRWSCGQEWLW